MSLEIKNSRETIDAFNASHAFAYSYISYWTAWIKANYPLIFYTTMFNGNLDDLSRFMEEAKKNGITINPPHVSHSKFESTIEDDKNKVIRIGLNAIKGVGPAAVESILVTQPYKSIDHFFECNTNRAMNKKVIEALIKANAFDGLGIAVENNDMSSDVFDIIGRNDSDGVKRVYLNRKQMWLWYEKYVELKNTKSTANYAIPETMIKGKFLNNPEVQKIIEKDRTVVIPEDRLIDFGFKDVDLTAYKSRKKPKGFLANSEETELKKVSLSRKPFVLYGKEISEEKENYLETYIQEVEDFGYSFLSHPLEPHMDIIDIFSDKTDGERVSVAGIITELQIKLTKNNKKFYWVMLQTPREKVRITVWDNQFKDHHKLLNKNELIAIDGIKGYGGLSLQQIKKIDLYKKA